MLGFVISICPGSLPLQSEYFDRNDAIKTACVMFRHFYLSWPCMLTDYLPLKSDYFDRDDAIETYFRAGFSYSEILLFLHVYHGVNMGYRQFQRILKKLGLRRNIFRRDLVNFYPLVINAVEQELCNTGGNLGYRMLQLRLKQKFHINISRHCLMNILKQLDPEGVERRLHRKLHRRQYYSKGPNHLWHIDGWDKLKQFGICIHGCIDGYSRRILWLEAAATNNDPYVICRYFSRCVKRLGGVPQIIRADRGTENINVEDMQTILRQIHGDNSVAFIYGKSTGNQRIESWWSKFGLLGMFSWISHFKNLTISGIIDTTSELHIKCVLFCYTHLIHQELNEIVRLWNAHYIRKSNNPEQPYGKPDVIYYLPDLYGGEDRLKQVHVCADDLDIISHYLTRDPPYIKDSYRELFQIIMEDLTMALPTNLDSAADLFVLILDTIENDLGE